MLILLALLFWPSLLHTKTPTALNFTQFQDRVTSGEVKSVTIDQNGAVTGVLTGGKDFTSQLPIALNRAPITEQLTAAHVQITAVQASRVSTTSGREPSSAVADSVNRPR